MGVELILLIDDFIGKVLSVPFCPYHFVRTILSNTILSVYHFVHTILPVPFCPLPFCPRTVKRHPTIKRKWIESLTAAWNRGVAHVHLVKLSIQFRHNAQKRL